MATVLSYAIPIIVVLGVLIGFHEFGHFVLAKLMGVKVLRFSIGFGPRIISKKIGETEYVLSLLPLGGYVKMAGEDSSVLEGGADDEKIPTERTFAGKSFLQKFLIVLAGPGFNLLSGFGALLAIFFFYGEVVLMNVVGSVRTGSPAARAGILPEDKIVGICENSDLSTCVPISEWADLQKTIQTSHRGVGLYFAVKRACVHLEPCSGVIAYHVVPELTTAHNIFGEEIKAYMVGLEAAPPVKMYNRGNLVKKAVVETYNYTALILLSIPKIFSGAISTKELGGPIAIGKLAHDAWQMGGLESFLKFTAFISINLAVVNLLPIPVLDGGYLWIFLPFEALVGRPMKKRPREILQKTGLFILLSLMLFVIFNDITRLIVW